MGIVLEREERQRALSGGETRTHSGRAHLIGDGVKSVESNLRLVLLLLFWIVVVCVERERERERVKVVES